MSRTVVIMIVSWLCIFSVSEATLGESCNETVDCTATVETCTNGSCECSSGHFNVSDVCNSSSITVSLSPQSGSAVYGSDVVLTATITSEVPLNPIKWLNGSKELNISSLKYTQSGVGPGQVTLNIKNVDFTDSGNYQVEVSNIAGNTGISNQISLTVTGEKPNVTVPGTITETVTTITIDCTASVTQNSPTITAVYWLLNGKNLNLSDSAKYSVGIMNTPSLTIKSIASTDAGEYRCGATNLVGSTTSSQSVNLAAPSVVTILQQPGSPVNYNSSITFTGSYTSNLLSVTIMWQKLTGGNFMDIDITGNKYTGSSDTGSSPKLVINPVQLIDEMSYRLVVSNKVGSTQSNFITLNVIGGNLTVTTGANVTGRFGGSTTIDCIVIGPEVSNIQWKRHINNNPEDISIDGQKYSGGSVKVKALTIHGLINNDATYQYQCTASNPRGVFSSANRATVQLKYGLFNEDCSNSEPCDSSKFLTCKNSKCLCKSTYYHKDQVCYPKTGLAPTAIFLNSTTNMFSVYWNNPTAHYELVSGYEVTWRFLGSSSTSSDPLERNVNQYNVSSGLMSGQLYTVAVISKVTLTNPADTTVAASPDTTVRLVPLAPGPIKRSESNFAHNNLQINWTAPVNTVVTKYEVTLNGTAKTTMSSDAMYQFTSEVYIPGKWYVISIVTVSGTASDIVKKSSEHTEWIRTTPTKPNPPTQLQCPQSPLDISLEISWTAPTEPNGLVLRYQIEVTPGNLQFYTSSNETHKNVEGLLPEQMYTFTIRTISDAVDNTSEPSQPITCNTKAGVSTAPTNLEINEVQSRGFRIGFNKPDNVSGILAAYKIVISKGGTCVQQILIYGVCSNCNSTVGCVTPLINVTVPDINNAVLYNASGLMPYTNYMVKVVAINGNGEGHPVNTTVMTHEEVPPQPEQINPSNFQSSSLTLTWTLPDPSPGNTTYTIYTYEGTDDNGTSFLMKESTKVHGFDTKTLSVTGLEEYWPYKFKVNAATVIGNTTSNFSSVFRTKQASPGKVLNLTILKKGSDYKSAYVSWSPPALRDRNGVLKSYLFSSNHTGTMEEEEIAVLLTPSTVEKNISVKPETVYIIEVVLQNNESMKSQISMQSYQAPAGPPPVTNIEPITTTPVEHKPTQNTIPININTTYFNNDENGKQVFVGIAVCAELKCKDMGQTTIKSVWESLPNWHKANKAGFPLYRVTNDTFMDKARPGDSRQKRSTISASTLPFTIGEDQTCSSLNEDVFCNGPLTAGTSYIVIIFACTNGGCTHYQTAEPYVTAKEIEKSDIPIGIISGVVVAVVVVLIIVGVAFVVVRRRNRLGETKQYTKGIDNQTAFDEPVPKNIPRKRPIKLKELSDKVAEKHKDSNLHFAREYEDLKALSPKHPAETSELDSNKLKNRYVNILPFDQSRVKLMLTEDDDPSTDFINANYLPGYKSQREYIATQGPIPGTIDDFWRMIWEQNVSIIVMLTLCKEEGRVKCEMYWPENNHEPKQYGDLVVETVSNSTVNFYDFRIFKIKLGDTTRSVKHFHFLQWKDFSANVQNDVMIDFIKNVRNHIRPPDMNGPVVVHCSAGVGRTGTYCALDHLFQFVDEHDLDESIDIFDLVMNLRERRMFMVQTEQQYIFIHDCLKDYLEKKLSQGKDECLYENQAFVADDEPMEESLYQNYSNQRTDL